MPITVYCNVKKGADRTVCANCTRWRGIFEGLSKDGGRKKLDKILHAYLFNEGPSIDATFSRIHLKGQYL